MANPTLLGLFDSESFEPLATLEDELDWQENQNRSSADIRRLDRSFVAGWLGLTGMWIVLAIIGSGAVGVIGLVAALTHR